MSEDEKLVFKRELEVNELFNEIQTPEIKVIIGLRRAGKSYLLNTLFRKKLLDNGYTSKCILDMDLSAEFSEIRSPESLKKAILENVTSNTKFLFIDEVQLSGEGYADVLISFAKTHKNISVYVTGSNSKTLSDDIRKAFKKNAKRIFLKPLPYSVVKEVLPDYSVEDYFEYGSLPIVLKKPKSERLSFLKELYTDTYLSDIKERFVSTYLSDQEKENIVENILSNITTPLSEIEIIKKITAHHKLGKKETHELKAEILNFIDTAIASFLLLDFNDGKNYPERTPKDYLNHNIKKYCFDLGILNVISTAKLFDKNSDIFENAIYLELLAKGINSKGFAITKLDENPGLIDFTFEKNEKKIFIQVAVSLNEGNRSREIGNLLAVSEESIRIVIYKNSMLLAPVPESIKLVSVNDFLSKCMFN